jgi:diguanylate cyclase (GGDEF)-like protein
VLGIVLLIVINLAFGYALALYVHRAEVASIIGTMFSTPAPISAASVWPQAAPMPNVGGEMLASSSTTGTLDIDVSTQAVVEQPSTDLHESPIATAEAPTLTKKIDLASNATSQAMDPRATVKPATDQAKAESHGALLALKQELNGYCSKIGTLNEQVRQRESTVTTDEIQTYAQQFDQLTNRYLEQQEQRVQSLRNSSDETGQALSEPCLNAIQQHTAAIESTREQVSGVGELVDAAAACRQFLLATGRLSEASQSLEKELDHGLSRTAGPISKAGDTADESAMAQSSAPVDTSSFAGLERAVAEFIRLQCDEQSKFAVALVEIDQLATINAQHGRALSDRILQAIEQTFVSLAPRSTLAADAQRQQLLYFQVDTSARDATHGVEQVRQRIAAAVFQHDGTRVPVTISCGVAEALGKEQPKNIVERLQEFLREAQRYGHNGTFFQEGQHSAPAIPPSISVESRVIEV